MGTLLRHPRCDGNCSYETFTLVRQCNEIPKVRDGLHREDGLILT
jgi:hypothetical protein